VYLVVRNLLEGLTYHDSVRTLRLRLEAFPPDLEAFFQHLINSVPGIYRVQLARSFQIATAAGEPVPAMFYSYLDDVGEDAEFAIKLPMLPLSKDELALRLERLRRRLDGRSRGLLEVVGFDSSADPVSTGSNKNLFLLTTVDFLHRTVRDYIHESPIIKSYIDQALIPSGELALHGCHAALALIKVAPFYGDHEWMEYFVEMLFYFTSQARSSGRAPDVLGHLLEVAETAYMTVSNGTSQLPPATKSIPHTFSALGARMGLLEYLENRVERAIAVSSVGPCSILDCTLNPPDASHPISLEVVALILKYGGRPGDRIGTTTVWSRFATSLPLRVQYHDRDAILKIAAALIKHGANPDRRQVVKIPGISGKSVLVPAA
jgi:hypothetical protein